MATGTPFEKGTPLEARIQRLFMCQGAFAERGLLIRAAKGESKLVTDIDVVAHDYSINFHHRRIYAECKGGKNRSPLDRAVWIRGIKEAIAADFAYLVLERCDGSTAGFAKSLGVEILQVPSLVTLETALNIGKNFWPGRSNLLAYTKADDLIKRTIGRNTRGGLSEWLLNALDVWRDASALTFSYGRLNSLLSALEKCGGLVLDLSSDENLVINYAVSALLVRLCQYVLFAASDTLAMSHIAREQYLAERLTVGNFDIEQSRSLLESASKMVHAQLVAQGQTPPGSWNVDHLLSAPPYARPFASVVERCISEGDKFRILALSMELRLFGYGGDERESGRLINRIRPAIELTGLVVAFARQSLGVPDEYVRGPLHYLPRTVVNQVGPRHNGEKVPDPEQPALPVDTPPADGGSTPSAVENTPEVGEAPAAESKTTLEP